MLKLNDFQDKKSVDPGSVIPGSNQQELNRTGVHWLRNSFDYKQLENVKKFVSTFFGDCEINYRGILSYSTRHIWASGVSLCFDEDPELRQRAHRDRITLDVPGSACDELTELDLLLFMEYIQKLNGSCSRIDVFFDDYSRTVSLNQLRKVIDKRDFSMFRLASKNETIDRTKKENGGKTYDAVTFGRRGSAGGGKYFRIYDKYLESSGEEDCIRWEMEFTQNHADKAFIYLAGCNGSTEAFVTLCGALVAGNILFVHRTGDCNIKRLTVYRWWEDVLKRLGNLRIRIAKKKCTLTGMIDWTERQLSSTLAVIRKTLASDRDYYDWMEFLIECGIDKMSNFQAVIAEQNAGSMIFNNKRNREKGESSFLDAMYNKVM